MYIIFAVSNLNDMIMNNRDNLLYFILILAVILMLNEHHVLTLAEPFKGVVNSLM